MPRSAAVGCASAGIRVNTIGPGSINTPVLQKYLDGLESPAAGMAGMRAAHPLGRWAEPDEESFSCPYLLRLS
jgi:NAD(P)-dependent dehydrogenase (short-subunit alcohol dehydrogenase family)